MFQTMRDLGDLAWALSQGISRGRRTDLADGLLVAAETIKVLAGHLQLLRKGSSLFVRGNPESLCQAARRKPTRTHPSLECPTPFLLFQNQ